MKDRSIKTKLSLLVTAATSLALALSCVGFAVYNVKMLRASKVQELSALATILGYNTASALAFDDPKMATLLLGSLRQQPSVESAWLYDAKGELFSTYPANLPPSQLTPPAPQASGSGFTSPGWLDVYQVILRDNEKLGSIHIRASLRDLERQFVTYSLIALLVLSLSLAGSFFLARRLQRFLTTPILRLVEVMHRVAKEDDYSIRATKFADDELGVLNDGLNAMLDQVERGRKALQQAHDELEERVVQRTSELSVAKDAAETANRAKSVFLASMSHELRTPLNAVLGFSQLMRTDPTLSDNHKENLDIINRSGAHLLGLINDVLEISRIEAGQVTRKTTDFDLWMSLETIREMMRSRANAKGLLFILERDPALPRYVRADERKLKQVILNLAGNAVKFTESGSVTLRASIAGQSHTLRFEVEDTGPGIEPEMISALFEPFVQGGHSKEGAGLGLFISQRLVEVMGGRITVRSERGKGSLFSFDIQCESAESPENVEDTTRHVVSLAGGRPPPHVLVAEDTLESRLLVVRLLQSVGFEVIEARNGVEAVRLFEERQPNLVLMDIRMPVMDGFEAIRTIRSTQPGKTAPIIAVTASAFDEERQRILAIGATEVVSKPVQPAELFEKIHLVLGVEYTYVEEPVENAKAVEQADLRTMLTGLPAELADELARQVALLNMDGVRELIPQVARHARPLAETLKELVDGYRVTELGALFQETKEATVSSAS